MTTVTVIGLAYSLVEGVLGKVRPFGAGSVLELAVTGISKVVTLFGSQKSQPPLSGDKSMTDATQTVSVPQNSNKLAQSLAKFTADVIAAKAKGLTGVALAAELGTDAISDLAGALPAVSGIEGEAAAEPIGVAEAFTLAGFQVARQFTGK